MKRASKLFAVILLLSLFFTFSAYGYNEGMSAVKSNSKEQVWMYMIDIENEFGMQDYLKNEWKQVWDNWYYFGEDGKSLQNTWAEIDEKWYYFDNWSIMLHDTVTPDGYTVGADGAWLVDMPQVTE